MRARLFFILVAIVLVGGFAALNWSEVMRTSRLNFGLILAEASLGGILLAALAVTLLVFLVSSAIQESRNLIEWNRHSKALQAQRDLADRAEASRFTDLRQHIDTTLRESRQREVIATSEFEKSLLQSQRELRTQVEDMNRMLVARLGELEGRIDNRLQPSYAGDGVVAGSRTVAPGEVHPADVRPGEVHPNDVPPRRRMNV
jgi:hypothetical protein